MFEVIAFGVEDVMVLVFDFPARPARRHQADDVIVRDGVAGGKGVVVEAIALTIGGGQFAPVDPQGVVAVAQGHVIEVAVGVDFMAFAGPAANRDRLQGESRKPIVACFVGVGLAHQEKVAIRRQNRLTQGLMTIPIIA